MEYFLFVQFAMCACAVFHTFGFWRTIMQTGPVDSNSMMLFEVPFSSCQWLWTARTGNRTSLNRKRFKRPSGRKSPGSGASAMNNTMKMRGFSP